MPDNPEDPEKRPAGRPPKDGEAGRDGHIHLRCDLVRKGKYVRAARKQGLSLADWIFKQCDPGAEK